MLCILLIYNCTLPILHKHDWTLAIVAKRNKKNENIPSCAENKRESGFLCLSRRKKIEMLL